MTSTSFPCGWLITITANHSNYLAQTEPTRSLSLSESGVKLQTHFITMPHCLPTIVLPEGRTRMFILHHFWLMHMPFLTLAPDGRLHDPGWEIPGPFFAQELMLICSIIWLGKRMLRVVVLRVLFFVDMRVAPYSVSLICIVWSCFYVKLMQIN